jgi:hypothetical protein
MGATTRWGKAEDGTACQSVAIDAGLCSYHARLREQLNEEAVANGAHRKRRNARERIPWLPVAQRSAQQ